MADTQSTERTRLIRAAERRVTAQQTQGMTREEIVRTDGTWAGVAKTDAHTFSGWHHHGGWESVVHVLRGRVRIEFGAGGRQVIDGDVDDTIYVAPGEVHREGNPGDAPAAVLVVRSGSGELVVNVQGPAPER